MDYPFENLSPEKFQHFAQALLTKEFPSVQCFPVAQPDGGRDAIQLNLFGARQNFIMYQVKFVREPESIDEPHKWLLSIIEKEAPKVKKQIQKGAKQYILITNLRGTAHPQTGSIDTANKILGQSLGVPSMCWWRDDLCRRLDSSWDIKWTYPELMTGPDLIRYVIEHGLVEGKERRASAIRAFIKYQYSIDQEVKFKQIELQNKLLDLFVDVPIEMTRASLFAANRMSYESLEARHAFFELAEENILSIEGTWSDVRLHSRIELDELQLDYLHINSAVSG